ncbi:hypothetical protein NL676_008555 [Syzygium grande]|nr:hypothetical protein NL676_008555 [Syzygium grande]
MEKWLTLVLQLRRMTSSDGVPVEYEVDKLDPMDLVPTNGDAVPSQWSRMSRRIPIKRPSLRTWTRKRREQRPSLGGLIGL